MAKVLLSLGSNINRAENIRSCIAALRDHFGEVFCSPVYESEAVGFDGDNFFNLVVQITTPLSLQNLSNLLRNIEALHGRDRSTPKFSARTLDIDILTYNNCVGNIEGVQLPRNEILKNAFVLQPLADLVPDDLHPQLLTSYKQLWQEYEKSQQHLWLAELSV
ncbi:2-amino-4-hydroxy-6-hydroxymethyldihydropteridine diphosphokinase [Alteromonadaceae bacterium 2753L.S.0a.02]|nr:2-amino-4-hydroxy-6-hydroxymethyldihydropteridine diphosphokinase [Alteromonadaceae bacterium 2753L.S.0a.02]